MLTNLLIIAMNNNYLEGSIPSEIGQLTRLQKLSLSSNDLTQDIPIEFGMLSDLQVLWVEELSISTQVPAEVCKLREENLNSFHIDCAPQGTSSNEIILGCDCCTQCF
jgi:Leucine-rich repeat (LRR) protein